ncbi:MAG: FAD:protein FMN transferase, partial [Candidatus Poribacteria bacterium]|nr:FAD:protein FMN transferase [Candidatus Poribacteria bacterium]
FTRITELNNHLSDYLRESELSRLSNTHDQLVQVSDDLWQVLHTAQEIAHASEGAFDVTTGPLTLLWRRAMRRAMLPDSTDLSEAMTAVGYEFLQLDVESQTARLHKDNMRLDLGGIAKGYAADQALEVLVREGFSSAAVDAGGDIALGEAPPNSDGWSIEVFSGESEIGEIILKNCGIAVSGDSYRYLDYQGVRYSHILDTETGYGVTHERKVAVIAPNAMIADAWASAYSVMDWWAIPLSIQERDGLSIRIVEPDGTGLRELETGKFRGSE